MFTMHRHSIGRTNYELLCVGSNAADYVLTFIVVRTCDVALWLAMYSYVCIPRGQKSKNLSIHSLYSVHLYQIRAIYKFCGIFRKGTHLSLRVPVRNCSSVVSSHYLVTSVYDCTFDFFLPRCHFLYIFGSRVGLPGVMKTKTGLDKFYGNFLLKIFIYKILYDISYIQ